MASKYCVIGDPIAHSKSPLLYSAMIDALGLDWSYEHRLVRAEDCADFLVQVKAEGLYQGFNATMPHKGILAAAVDSLDPIAARTQSVNTVVMECGIAHGYSTDGIGVIRALDSFSAPWKGACICLLGAGGAAAAAAAALLEAGAERIILCNRTIESAKNLAQRIGGEISVSGFSAEELAQAARQSAVLLNCTSLGMENGSGTFPSLDFLKELGSGAAVFDMVYAPSETALYLAAKELGLLASTGLPMLMYQAIAAMELYTGRALDAALMTQVIARRL